MVAYNFSNSAPAGTYETSFNPSTDLTGSNANGVINFNGSTQNSAVATIQGFTATPTRTSTLTPTVTPETVVLLSGTVPSSLRVPGAAQVPVFEIQAQNNGADPVTLTSLKLKGSGTGDEASGISSVALFLDLNNNGVVDAGEPLLASGSYTGNDGTVTLNFSNLIQGANAANYLVVYNFSSSAPTGTYQAGLMSDTDLTGVDGTTLQPLVFTGAPINGGTITLQNGTPTATLTVTVTSSATATITPTITATSSIGRTPIVFPNPADGTKPVMVAVNLAQATDQVTVEIFTVAFRKVQETTYSNSQNATASALGGAAVSKVWTVPVTLTDKWGTPLASGLYYVIVGTPNGKSVGKLLIER